MANLSEEEARALVAVRGHCDDVDQWKKISGHEDRWELQSGILDEFGSRCDQFVRLEYVQSGAGGHTHFRFTLFLTATHLSQRIYQLDIHRGCRPCKSRHQLPHEHIGAYRVLGPACWGNWNFESALAHFCHRANIYFNPVPHCPTVATEEVNHARKHR